ncbi:MAG TPA: hypothetical protein G4O05_10150 [Caldilineae bacterium]|nr:hypothetical protein [Caldilineae bacterium]HIQ11503.1 hypothetical protein [Caldilineales bacterium]
MNMKTALAWPRWAILILVLWAAFGLRLYRLDVQDIWWDEARNIDVATRPLSQVAIAPELDIHPPLYFYTLHAWTRAAGASPFATRFLSVWFGILAIALTYQLGRKLTPGLGWTAGTLALTLAAFAAYGLAEAQETRMYTMSWAILAAGMLALLRALRCDAPFRHWLLFGALAGIALLTHYSTVFILAAWGVWLVVWALKGPSRWERLSRLAAAGLTALLLFAPVTPIALRQIPGYKNPNLTLPTLSGYLSQLYRAFTLGEFAPATVWAWGTWLWSGVVIAGALLWLTTGDRQQKSDEQRHWTLDIGHWTLLMTWLFGGLAIFYLILIARSAFNPRYISFILPALWALAGWALLGWRSVAPPLPWLAMLLILGLSIPSLRADLFDPAHFREDMTGVVRYLEARATPNDIILVDQRYPFGFYWPRWNNDFDGSPPDQPADQPPAQYLFVDIDHIDERLSDLAGRAQKVFYVTWYESDMDPRGAASALLDAYGQRIDEQHFRGYAVRVWRMHPPTHFQLPRDVVSLDIPFDPGVTLVTGDWFGRAAPVAPGASILAALRWRAEHPTDRPYKVSLRLKDAAGATLAQDDRLLLSNRHLRTPAWSPGEEALNVYLLPAPDQPGVYQLSVVVYDEETLAATGTRDGRGVEPVIGLVKVGK